MRASLLALLLALPAALAAQPTGATLVASGFAQPLGLTVDAQGRVWVAQAGTGADDGRIDVVLPDGQTTPFLTGLRSDLGAEGPEGLARLTLRDDALWFTMGFGNQTATLHRIATAGWTPGDAPHTPAEIAETVDVGAFVLGQGFSETHPYGLAFAADGTLYLADAGANALLRRDAAGDLAVLATFPDLPNPTPVGGPFVQVVPTAVVVADGRLYVSALTGFPFPDELARVYAVELDGSVAVFRDGLTTLTDLARDPRDGALTALQFARFGFDPPPPGFLPATGRALRLADDRALAAAFSFASAAAYAADGTLYVATLTGDLYRVDSAPVAAEPGAAVGPITLSPPVPNPATGAAALTFVLDRPTDVRLTLLDATGREVAVLARGAFAPGGHTVRVDGTAFPAGLYLARLTGAGAMVTQRLAIVR